MKNKKEERIINDAIRKLQFLTGEDFHGYRSKVWGVIAKVIKEIKSKGGGE